MEKWIKDALKKADADIIEMTWPRSNDRRFAKHVASVIKQRLQEESERRKTPVKDKEKNA